MSQLGHEQKWTRSFDHLVGAQQERWLNRHSECARRPQVYCQLEFGWLLDRQISRLCAAQNLVDEADDMPITEQIARSIGDRSANLGGLGPLICRRQARIADAPDRGGDVSQPGPRPRLPAVDRTMASSSISRRSWPQKSSPANT